MKNIVEVKGLKIGEGQPKICVPVTASNIEEIKKQARNIMFSPADLVEWRADYMQDIKNHAYIKVALGKLHECIENKPVIVTLRTAAEGGKAAVDRKEYAAFYESVIDSGMADIVDIEYFQGKNTVKRIIAKAHSRNVKVIISFHDFSKTPSVEDMIKRLNAMKFSGADIVKMAVMPNNSGDVLKVLNVSESMKNARRKMPFIIISMSAYGIVSRIACELFGSAVTFASAGRESAPGQINADEIDRIMGVIHRKISEDKNDDGDVCKNTGQENRRNRKNIVITGFMGAGKSSVARHISRKTGMEVREIDRIIEESEGCRIKEIFERRGEKYFRDIETREVKKLAGEKGVIISCGGGTVMRPENVKALKSSGRIFFLRAKPDTVYERVKRGGDKRPVLNRYMSRGYVSWLMKQRDDAYMDAADTVIDVDGISSEKVAMKIMDMMGIKKK